MKALLFLLTPLFVFAKCTYNIHLDFDLQQSTFKATANVIDSSKTLNINFKGFSINNKEEVIEKLSNGANRLSFSYNYTNPNISEDFISLLGNWYPSVHELCQFNLTTNLENSYKTIYEKTNKPIKNATFIASKDYNISTSNYNGIALSTYFFKDNNSLAQQYLEKTKEYIKLYEKLIGKFPFKQFNIVENHQTTGYSMPTYTLVGSYLLNKPYLLNRSLGHEILHQYFGNSIFYENQKGNYGEGLVTHLADNYYAKQKGEKLINRKESLVQFDSFATKDFPAASFTHRYDKNSMAIGYTKVAYIFDMLEEKLGSDKFFEVLQKLYKEKKFTIVNLNEIQAFFNAQTNIDLTPFFQQWFEKIGRIDFHVTNIKQSYHRGVFSIKFTIKQENDFTFDLPLDIQTYDGKEQQTIRIHKKEENFTLNFSSEVQAITFDKELSLFRKLFKEEYPLNIGKLINEKNLIIVMDKKYAKAYSFIAKIFPNGKLIYTKDLKFSDVKKNSILFLDKNNETLQHFLPRLELSNYNSFLSLYKNTFNEKQLFAVLHTKTKLPRSFFMLKHYGNYKAIAIENRTVKKFKDNKTFGLKHTFSHSPKVSIVKKPQFLNNIANELDDAKIIYATESHENMTHHLNQLRIIKALVNAGKKVTIAMEMFQTPYQNALDDYVAGKTNVNQFLKESQYYKRWKYNYNYYKPILEYAKANKIKVLAINIDREIVRQVNKNGLLAFEDKTKLPKKIDQSNGAYKESLTKIFEGHGFSKYHKNPHAKKDSYAQDFFFQSQLIWDEAMGENISKYVKQHPEQTVVVLVGSGHVEKHYGIPSRVYADTKLPYRVVLNDMHRGLENDILIFNEREIKIKKSLKLGVYLNTDKHLKVIRTKKDSFSEKIGLKKDDILLQFNNEVLTELADLKRLLYFEDNYKDITITVQRGNKTLHLKAKK